MGHTKASLCKELCRVFKILSRPFSRKEFDEVADIHSRTLERFFGSWSKALEESGLSDKFEEFAELEEEKKSFDPQKELEESWKEEKKRLLERAEERKVKWLREQAHKMDVLKDMLSETLAKADPPVVEVHPIKVLKRSKSEERCTLWFDFSDLQLGTLMTASEMGGLNKHNWVIWKNKLEIWKRAVIQKIADYSERYNIDDVVVACLGDMVEGNDIFQGQVWQIDRHVVDQAILGANDTAAAFIEIFLTFPKLKFRLLEVFGNHGRVQRKGETPYSCSMDKVYQRMLELQIAKVSEVKNLDYYHNEAWFFLIDVYGWNHLLLHGDRGMSSLWSSRPTINGMEKGTARYIQMMQQQVHFLHCGHFHQDAQISFNLSQILINGSFIGTSNFSASQMVASSPPAQSMYVFTPRVGLAAKELIYLTDGDVKIPLEPNNLRSGLK